MTKKNPSQEAGVFCLVGWALSNDALQCMFCADFEHRSASYAPKNAPKPLLLNLLTAGHQIVLS